MSWSWLDFKRFSEAENPMNQQYDEAYISVFIFSGTPYFVEHNQVLSEDELNQIAKYVNEALLEFGVGAESVYE